MLLAHSDDGDRGIPAQSYTAHIDGVSNLASCFASETAAFARHDRKLLKNIVMLAAEFHDLGKLDETNQNVLSGKCKARSLPVQHTDAGTAYLLNKLKNVVSAVLVRSHHIGLPDFVEEKNRGEKILRDDNISKRVDQTLVELVRLHESVRPVVEKTAGETIGGCAQLLFRIALSCLADADHTDTAIHYGDQIARRPNCLLRPIERLAALDRYVESLKEEDDRSRLRSEVYNACRNAEIESNIVSCNSPVGTGKTTAVMAHLLSRAEKYGLRRIIVVLPFTNIITQSVEIYRKALALPGEDPEQIVAELHHRADFQDVHSRQFTACWNTPIIVTTAVSFFETLASNTPSTLRRLHNLPGSAVFIDESHAALPAKLWPLAWQWLKDFANDWGCYWVMASGSLNRFWEIEEFNEGKTDIPELLPIHLGETLYNYEHDRIDYHHKTESLSASQIVKWANDLPGPRLLIVNTVQSAAVIAKEYEKQFGREKVEHISTALTPVDRKNTLDKVKTRLQCDHDNDWTLVATSCVEAGVNLSFKTGFREAASLVSLLQTSGRVNRHGNYNQAMVWSFTLKEQDLLKKHPSMRDSANILLELFSSGETISPSLCTEAFRREIRLGGSFQRSLLDSDNKMRFPQVEKDFRVINSDTRVVVIDKEIIEKLENHRAVTWQDIQKYSVHIWGYRLSELKVPEILASPGIYKWNYAYNNFIGYMTGILPIESVKNGNICII